LDQMDYTKNALFEHRFWLQILGDHSRFILHSLSPKEKREIEQANYYIQVFDQLLAEARESLSVEEIHTINAKASEQVRALREFKLHLLHRHLVGKIATSLPPTFFNHMLNELEEYQRVLHTLTAGKIPLYTPVHEHLLWLLDAVGHAETIVTSLDPTEKEFQLKGKQFAKQFQHFYLKAIEIAGYMRTNLQDFPALSRFSHQIELEMELFRTFLKELKDLRINNEVLGTLSPLMADHMAREECYFLTKLANVTNIKKPHCDPTKPRY
jgi:hypothetical protein